MRTFVLSVILSSILPVAAVADTQSPRVVFGLASNDAVQVLQYGERPASFQVIYPSIERVPGFEGCEIHDLIFEANLVCGDESYRINAPTRVGECQYRGIHREDGLGIRRKATWDAWIQAARACGETEERIAELQRRLTSAPIWAGNDNDPRYE